MCYCRIEVCEYLFTHGGILASTQATILTFFQDKFGKSFDCEDNATKDHAYQLLKKNFNNDGGYGLESDRGFWRTTATG